MYLLLGPPCSGKTTLGTALSKELGLPHIVASGLLKTLEPREDSPKLWRVVSTKRCLNVRSQKDVTSAKLRSLQPRELIRGEAHGQWLALTDEPGFCLISGGDGRFLQEEGAEDPETLQVEIIMNRLQQPDCDSGFVLDNFPRTAAQAKLLEARLLEKFNRGVSCVLDLEVPVKVLESRAGIRLVDRNTGLPVHLELSHSQDVSTGEHINEQLGPPHDGSLASGDTLMRRSDDVPEVFQHRLERYANNIAALRNFYGPDRCKALTGTLENHEVLAEAQRIIRSQMTLANEATPAVAQSASDSSLRCRRQVKPHLFVHTLGGREMKLDVSNMSTVGEVKDLISRQAGPFRGVPAGEQKLLLGTTELANSDILPPIVSAQENVTIVRQRMENDPYEPMRCSLCEGEEYMQPMSSLVLSFSAEVSSQQNWLESNHTEPCGCRTKTNRYIGKDPPECGEFAPLYTNISGRVEYCRSELRKIRAQDWERHRQLQEMQNEAKRAEMDSFAKFWNSVFFSCCMPPPPEDHNASEIESRCKRLLQEYTNMRNTLTQYKMRTATKTTKTNCAQHEPPPPEPGSP